MYSDDPIILRDTMKALSSEFPRTEEGFAALLHSQLYFRFMPLYIYYMKLGMSSFLPEPKELIRPKGIDLDIVDELVQAAVKRCAANLSDVTTSTYHAKVVRFEEAEQIIELTEDLNLGELPKTIMPYDHAVTAIIKNPESLAVVDCVCRTLLGEKGCYPRDVCIVVGEPWVSWSLARDNHLNGRRITRDEALQILKDTQSRGNVHAVFFKDVAADRIYSICNCCPCCCTAIQSQNYLGSPMLTGTGYKARIDAEKCVECGICANKCNFNAITIQDGKPVVDDELCMGCEACQTACPNDSISMELIDHAAPFDIKKIKSEMGQ